MNDDEYGDDPDHSHEPGTDENPTPTSRSLMSTKPSPFDDEGACAFVERSKLLSRDLCQNLLYPEPQVMRWVKPAGSRVAFLIDMRDEDALLQN